MIEAYFPARHRRMVEERRRDKLRRAQEVLGSPPAPSTHPEPAGGRTRLDLMWDGHRLGIRGPSDAAGRFDFIPIANPDSAAPAVRELAATFASSSPPLPAAQVRFRSAPSGAGGIWIDTSRAAIEALVADPVWLEAWVQRGVVMELGQRGEEFGRPAGRPVLVPAVPRPWLPSFGIEGRAIPLDFTVASFSQPGPEANHALIKALVERFNGAGIGRASWCEWGAGYGNLTAALASRLGPEGVAVESDPALVSMLVANSRRHFPAVMAVRGRAGAAGGSKACGSAASPRTGAAEEFTPRGAEVLILDPPRPGFPELLRGLAGAGPKPRWVAAVHCQESGLSSDSALLPMAGYELREWSGIDTFPGSRHLEVVSLWAAVG